MADKVKDEDKVEYFVQQDETWIDGRPYNAGDPIRMHPRQARYHLSAESIGPEKPQKTRGKVATPEAPLADPVSPTADQVAQQIQSEAGQPEVVSQAAEVAEAASSQTRRSR